MFIFTGIAVVATFLTVMKILLEKLFKRGSICREINFCKGDYGEEKQVVAD